jgi:hypothetical protein
MKEHPMPVGATWVSRRCAVLMVSASALAGCETKLPSEMSHTEAKQFAQQIYQRCLDQGVVPGTDEMNVCTKHESYREIDQRFKNRATVREVGRGLQNAADNYNRANQQRPVTCTSTAAGPTIRTTCY